MPPRPRSQCASILPVPGEWFVLQQGHSRAGTWGTVQGGRINLKNNPPHALLTHILSSDFKKQ